MIEVVNLFKFLMCNFLCLVYSSWIGLRILVDFVFKRETKFWVVKDRPIKPKSLTSSEYGEHKFMSVNGIKIHYVEKGDSKKPLMLFVHGFPEFWYSWRYQLKEFSKDYHCIAIDQRGYAESDKPSNVSDYHIDKMVGDIRQFVNQLGREKFTLVAHDWGAVIGFRYALKHMDTLEKYVMIGGPPSEVWNTLITYNVKQFLMSWYVFYFQMPFLPEYSTRLHDLQIFKAMQTSELDMEVYKYYFGQPGALTGPINYYRAAAKFLFPDPPLPRPSSFVPGLFMIGERDRYISRQSGKMAQRIFDKLEFKLIKGGNHFAQQHSPEETNRLIREFLEKK